MPKFFEIFGYPVEDNSEKLKETDYKPDARLWIKIATAGQSVSFTN